MAAGDLIDFDVIEGQKENIQALPSGRSARKLVETFSSSPLHKLNTPTPTDSKSVNDCIRAEYEAEVAALSESDDPLDIFDRYVRWTFDAYPSAQATSQSQLHTLLERATKAFIGSAQYKNDPRYLKLWLHYIHFFSDSPRETYIFLSRHSIGETLALFYEEYAAWLESVGRWSQAEEVYKLGIEREARPVQRLVRKFGEFERRRAEQPNANEAPSSPALPKARNALAAKVDPFSAAAAAAADPQAPRPNMGVGGTAAKPGKAKMAIFSDADVQPSALSSRGGETKGWDTIGSLADRKKENVMEARPWAGETLETSVKKSNGPKMAIFRDPSLRRIAESHIMIAPSKHQIIVNPNSGKRERIFVNLEAVYPTPEEPGTELSFEELWAASRGWLDTNWEEESEEDDLYDSIQHDENEPPVMQQISHKVEKLMILRDDSISQENRVPLQDPKPSKPRRKKGMEVNETQIIKVNLDSPTKPKPKSKKKSSSSEPTMTMHTKAATDDIYDIFNAPLKPSKMAGEESDEDEYMTDGDYTSGAESTATTRQVDMTEGELGDVEMDNDHEDDEDDAADNKSVASDWSDFTREHVAWRKSKPECQSGAEDDTISSQKLYSQEYTGDVDVTSHSEADYELPDEQEAPRTRFMPVPPEDYVAPTRPYRDPAEVANNRLPFMTPITERTEMSMGFTDARSNYYKTPSKNHSLGTTTEEDEDEDEDYEPLSSPIREVVDDNLSPVKIPQPLLHKVKQPLAPAIPKGPIIKDLQCNPVDPGTLAEILSKIQPPLSSYPGFYDHRHERFEKGSEIRRYTKAQAKALKNGDRTSGVSSPVQLEFPELSNDYTVRRQLGEGAFAPIYLVENSQPEEEESDENSPVIAMGKGAFATSKRASLEALKMEEPPSAWEFHMMRLAASRLGPNHRATASISAVHELHLYQDDGYLFLPFHPHGTLLDVVNMFRKEQSGTLDEPLAMFFAIEMLRTVEALHSKQLMHGDLKADNCLLRLDTLPGSVESLTSQWHADGSGGWGSRGVVLIDFGRGIDMRAFDPEVQFIADWQVSPQDCAEIRDGRPWTWQLDYHGLAGVIHTLLFGKYIETVRADSGGLGTQAGRRYKIRENLKRYWQTDIWNDCFDVLLNPASHASDDGGDGKMPVTRSLRRVREGMECWLEANCERGVGLKTLIGRVENMARQLAAAGARKG
ncbi:Mad3/BUB1 homology region 1-domain-containing protein [Microdochium trichocladiopsis]|uniref:Mad3/BUB1 homology region 1-domain-containing protein n=1 Tax=Microdochium trichocladiopsis TaxID=1682393 RepID=A0A9P8YAL3_9PEZI|nr:Mad3/BUB1 homology region 1-domain-containing protein [Microdochium trichocladiopsis]KAH7034973.1 Mad3/BUB1 homology region 1-domain-containing protein [Microdochium trichocladiopsis]